MTEFKVGDAVKYVGTCIGWEDRLATVIEADRLAALGGGFDLKIADANSDLLVSANELVPADDSGVGVSRYTAGMPEGVEARHIMETQDWYEGFCKGSILKYITRLDHKGQYLSDLKKIKAYADELIRLEEAK